MAGLYVHIPFCKQKCHYCNFYSLASQKHHDQIIQSIILELRIRSAYLAGEKLNTVYFGGGTPSLFQPQVLNSIVEQAHQIFGINENAEITIEANPDDISPRWLADLQKTSINRLSIGVQSFDDADLKYLNRRHNAAKAQSSIKLARENGFDNLSIDLIYGSPNLSDEIWLDNISKAIQLGMTHISAYALTVEPGTALDHFIRKGKYQAMDDTKASRHFHLLTKILKENGFEHYEISNFCLPGKYSKHNTSYWFGEKYLGVGPSAHSFDGKSRQWNVSNLKSYISAIENNEIDFDKEILNPDQKYNEYVMTALRTMWGIDLYKVKNKFGEKYHAHLLLEAKPFIERQKIQLLLNKITLTEKGKFFADGVAAGLFV
jgi:oxygen-independent coproporphyrinogen-3 oxidase